MTDTTTISRKQANTPLTEDYLAQVEARANAAEDGWCLVPDADDPYRFEIHGDGPTRVAVFGGDPDDSSASYPTEENARFAVHARWDVPALVAEVRRLRAIVDGAPAANPGATLAHLQFINPETQDRSTWIGTSVSHSLRGDRRSAGPLFLDVTIAIDGPLDSSEVEFDAGAAVSR